MRNLVLSVHGPDRPGVFVAHASSEARLRSWDKLVRSCAGADVAQLSGWARVRAVSGFKALYVFAEDEEQLVGGAQVLVRSVPALGGFGYVPYGPLIAPWAPDPGAARESLAAALAGVARKRVLGLFVQPPEGGEQLADALVRKGFRASEANVAPSVSLRVDLSLDEERLRRNLSRRLRGWTRRWEARGVTVRRGGPADLPLAAELHARTAAHQGFTPLTIEHLAAMERELSPEGHFFLLIAELDGEPAAMGVYTGNGGVLKARLVGLDRSTKAARQDVVAALDWHALIWAKRNGHRWFDFSGFGRTSLELLQSAGKSAHESLPGPDRYKLRFGGVPYRYPQSVELFSSPAVRLSYDLVRRSSVGRGLHDRTHAWARTGAWPTPARRTAGGHR